MANMMHTVVLALSMIAMAQSAMAASYVGCFPAVSFGAATPTASVAACEQTCAAARMPLVGMIAGGCACSAVIPSGQVEDARCAAGDKAVAAVYYRNADATKGCRVAPAPLTPGAWAADGNPEQIQYTGSDGVTLALHGINGPRLNTPEKTSYGLYQVSLKACGQVGCNTAFYMTSDITNANFDHDEIDMEFINAHPSTGPGGLWPNSWINGQRTGPERLAGTTDISSNFKTYTIDWQPSALIWYVDGAYLIDKSAPVPSKPQHTMVSIWTKNSVEFGGVPPEGHEPYYSSFKGVNRILCDQPEPKSIALAPIAAVPVANTTANTTTAAANTTAAAANTTTAVPSPAPKALPSPAPTTTSTPTPTPTTTTAEATSSSSGTGSSSSTSSVSATTGTTSSVQSSNGTSATIAPGVGVNSTTATARNGAASAAPAATLAAVAVAMAALML